MAVDGSMLGDVACRPGNDQNPAPYIKSCRPGLQECTKNRGDRSAKRDQAVRGVT